jgi:hypothetical protein
MRLSTANDDSNPRLALKHDDARVKGLWKLHRN